jgi:ribonucleoside-triphosphate reductase
MKFFTILRAMTIDNDFVDLLEKVPMKQLDNLGLTKIDVFEFRRNYMATKQVQSISNNPNANVQGKSPNNFRGEQNSSWNKLDGLYWLWQHSEKLYGRKRADHLIGEILKGHLFFHKLSMWDMHHCFSFSVARLLLEGRPYSRLVAKPSKHLPAFMGQVTETAMDFSQDQNGAFALSSLAISMAALIKREGKKYDRAEIENYFQSVVHILNNQFRVSGDSPFTNISLFSKTHLKKMYGDNEYFGFKFDDIEKDIHEIQDVFLEFMAKGDPSSGLMYRFPIITINIHPDDIDDPEVERMLRRNKEGFFNINRTDQVAMCCRLQMKKKERISSLGTGGDNIGAVAVVTINLPSEYYEGKVTGESIEHVHYRRLQDSRDLLLAHLDIMKDLIEAKYLKFFTNHWIDLKMLYCVIGNIGMPELLDKIGLAIGSREWMERTKIILKMNAEFTDNIKEWDFNFEMVPGESAAGSMARSNRFIYGSRDEIYSNQFVPLSQNMELHKRLEIESELSRYVTGGSMVFINIDEKPDEETMLKLQMNILKNTKIPQFAINIGRTKCNDCGFVKDGKMIKCTKCDSINTDFWTRIVGYFVPESSFEPTRQEELKTRVFYGVENI